jgi:hypothetical protein
MKLLASYRNGGYRVDIYSDGTKVRTEVDPALPPELPEQLDLKLTGCATSPAVQGGEG